MAAQQPLTVDWESVKEELDAIDDSWKQARFDSLSHVVEVLTSQNPEEATRTLKEQRDAIEEIVDEVVRGYHKGFNKAIHNYSQILKLFSDSATGVSTLKAQLAECKSLLGAKHKQLQQQWYRSITLRHVITLLDQIDHVSQVPSRIEHLIAEKKYYAAVQLHIKSISMLEREGIQGVGALQGVRVDLSKLQSSLFNKVVEDLHSHLYMKGEHSPAVLRTQDADDDLSSIDNFSPLPSLHPISRRTRTFKRQGSDVPEERWKASQNGGSSSLDGKDDDSSQSGDVDSDTSKASVKTRPTPPWLADAVPNEFVVGITKSDAASNVKYLQTMVECLNLLGKTAAAGAIISQRLRQTLHDLIADEIKNQAASLEASRPRVEVSKITYGYRNGMLAPTLKKEHQQAAFSIIETSMGPTGPAQTPARQLLQSVLDILARVLENHVTVTKALGTKGTVEDDSRSAGGYNLSLVFTVSQNECQQLICDILQVNPETASKETAVQAARSISKAQAESNGSIESGMSFSFRVDTAAMTLPGADRPRRRGSTVAPEGFGTGSVLAERGIYLIAALYRPTLEFTDRMASILPENCAHLAKEGLQKFIEKYIKDQFLPMIVVDYRTRAADALASSAAFRPKPQSIYETTEKTVERAPIALLGPFVADTLATEVLAWARAMPKYAAEFLELVQTILDRTLERCRAVFTEAVLGTLSSSFIGRTDVAKLMDQEAANAFIDGSKQDGFLNAEEDMEVEMEMNNLLLSLRPVRQEQILKDDHKFVLLAALSESLDTLSASIRRIGEKGSSQKKEHTKHSSALLLDLQELATKYHGLSVECLRALRVEMQLQAIFYLQSMTTRVYVSDQDAEEPEDFIVTFTTQITRWDEEMAHYIPATKRNYIFGGICGVSATAFIKALSDMPLVNVFGVRQICRNCIALQQALAALGSSSGDMEQERLDRVRTYYELLTMPFEALKAFVAEHQTEFSFQEFSSLLQVNVPGREIPVDAFQSIGRILAP